MGPLLFLKIEGDKHFLPPSYSLIANNLYLFLVSLSEVNPFLYVNYWIRKALKKCDKNMEMPSSLLTIFCLKFVKDPLSDENVSCAVALLLTINFPLVMAIYNLVNGKLTYL